MVTIEIMEMLVADQQIVLLEMSHQTEHQSIITHQLQIKLQLHHLLKGHQISHLQAQIAEQSVAQEALEVMAVEEDNLSFYAQTINSSF